MYPGMDIMLVFAIK
uniref:Uncharacterized protein n=1 Tax=Arundo donax TaxID=35708 RepID=A0A0A9AQX8_ARUDO